MRSQQAPDSRHAARQYVHSKRHHETLTVSYGQLSEMTAVFIFGGIGSRRLQLRALSNRKSLINRPAILMQRVGCILCLRRGAEVWGRCAAQRASRG